MKKVERVMIALGIVPERATFTLNEEQARLLLKVYLKVYKGDFQEHGIKKMAEVSYIYTKGHWIVSGDPSDGEERWVSPKYNELITRFFLGYLS